MLRKFTIKPFPTSVGEYISLPDISELVKLPVLKYMDIRDVRKLNNPVFNMLLDKAPITGTKEFTAVYCFAQYLYVGCTATIKRIGEWDSEWHIDNAIDWYEDRDIIHIFQTESTAPTEFNEHEISFEVEESLDKLELRQLINERREELNIKGKPAPFNRFVTTDRHLHRANVPKMDSFRFLFGIIESDFLSVKPFERAIDNTSYVYIGTKKVKNIENINRETIIHKEVE